MPTATYIALANLTLTGTDASIEFASIPSTYRDLVLVVNCEQTGANSSKIRVNSDTGANYHQVVMRGATTASAESLPNETQWYASSVNTQGSQRIDFYAHFLDYSATDKHKLLLVREGHNASVVEAGAGRWANTNAINTITVFLSANEYAIGSTFALYGIVS